MGCIANFILMSYPNFNKFLFFTYLFSKDDREGNSMIVPGSGIVLFYMLPNCVYSLPPPQKKIQIADFQQLYNQYLL